MESTNAELPLRKRAQIFVVACNGNAETDVDEIASGLFQLITDAPKPVQQLFGSSELEQRFRQLLDCGATLNAAYLLTGEKMGCLLSRSPAGKCLATLSISTINHEATFTSDSLEKAILGAIATVLRDSLDLHDKAKRSGRQAH